MNYLINFIKSNNCRILERNFNQIRVEKRNTSTSTNWLTQATFYTHKLEPTSWFLFEKYDGIRAIWNAQKRVFLSRSGKELLIPDHIKESMPNFALDGEFWFGKGSYSEAQKISGKADFRKINWDKFRYMVFDCPNNVSYKERYQYLESIIPKNHPFVVLAEKVTCQGKDHLVAFAKKLIEEGGEGVILRNPDATYKQGRSKDYVKFKIHRDDEARLIEQTTPGVWSAELPNGLIFEAPIEAKLTENREPKPGDIVSFKYTRYSPQNGLPLSSVFYRFRDDMSWSDLISKTKNKQMKKKKVAVISINSTKTSVPKGFWSDVNNRREFFENFAKEKQFDPLDVNNWYKVKTRDIVSVKHGGTVMNYYQWSVRKAIEDVFPSIKFDDTKILKRYGYWNRVENCRKFFDEFAEERGFDPSNPDNWYKITNFKIRTKKGGIALLYHFQGSPGRALKSAYPEIDWNDSKFVRI